MFDSITPYDEIFRTEDKKNKRKTVNKNNCFYDIESGDDDGYKICRITSTDPNLYLDLKNSPGQKFFE